jgi:hypothetical protein
MRLTTACLLLAGASLAATRIGGLAWLMVVALAAVAAASSSGLAALAMVRLMGTGFLGRPRLPRPRSCCSTLYQKHLTS